MINKLFFIGMSIFILGLTSCSNDQMAPLEVESPSFESTVVSVEFSNSPYKDGTNGTIHDVIAIVKDGNDLPINNAVNHLYNDTTSYLATTNELGQASIDSISTGNYTLTVETNDTPRVVTSFTQLNDTLRIQVE